MSARTSFIVWALLAVVLSGCSSYSPPAADEAGSATIHIVEERFMHHVYILEVDGLRTSQGPLLGLVGAPSEIKVRPGYRVFLIQGGSSGLIWYTKLWLAAEPNKSYYLRSENKGHSFRAWFQESGKVEPVGGGLPFD